MMLIIYIALGIALAPYILELIVLSFGGCVLLISYIFKKLKNPIKIIIKIIKAPFIAIKYILDGFDRISKAEIKWWHLLIFGTLGTISLIVISY